MSEPDKSDVFLDPFAGSGAIPLARSKYPYELLYGFDKSVESVSALKINLKGVKARKKRPIILSKADARTLSRFDDGFVSKIVTDPPWGRHETIDDVEVFYSEVFKEFLRILAPKGLIVTLIGDRDLVKMLSNKHCDDLCVEININTLVNGQPAALTKWRRL